MKRVIVILMGVYLSIAGIAQIPHSYQQNTKHLGRKGGAPIPYVNMPSFDVRALKREKAASSRLKPYRFAKTFDVKLSIYNSGVWDTLANGDKIWYLGIVSQNAYSLNLIFDPYHLPKGGTVYIYNPEKTHVLGGFTHQNNKPSGVFPVSPIPSDTVIVEYRLDAAVKDPGELRIKTVGHDYKNILKDSRLKDDNYGDSDHCQVDINCPAGQNWQKEKNAVCRILYGGGQFCTGTLMNNTNQNAQPYILTAHHCLESEYQANTAIFVFQYESPVCNGPDGSADQSISSATLKATANDLDFSLVQTSASLPLSYRPYFAGWDVREKIPDRTVMIHHPQGDVKKISKDNNTPSSATFGGNYDVAYSHWLIREWELGATEGGSSGGPLFNQDHRVVGDLTGGDAKCGDPVKDYVAKISYSWDYYSEQSKQLKYWLAPNASSNRLDGYDPISSKCDTLTNIAASDSLVLSSTNGGYLTGHNQYSIRQYAEHMTSSQMSYIVGALMNVAKAYAADPLSKITLLVWEDQGGKPGNVLATNDIYLKNVEPGARQFFELDTSLALEEDFFMGYRIYYSVNDTFALYQTQDRETAEDTTSYVYDKGQWISYNERFDMQTAIGLGIVGCHTYKSAEKNHPSAKSRTPEVYPNPVSERLFVELPASRSFRLMLCDITGKPLKSKVMNQDGQHTPYLQVNDLKEGVYILKVMMNQDIWTKKVIISH